MPSVADRKRGLAIREYFRANYLGKASTAKEAKEDIIERFRLPRNRWYAFQAILDKEIESFRRSGETPAPSEPEPGDEAGQMMELTIPGNLDSQGKEAFSRLLTENLRLSSENQSLSAQAAQAAMQVVQAERRSKSLKRIVELMLDSI